MSDKLLYRIPEVAEHLSISRSKVYELLKSGELRSVHIDRTRLPWRDQPPNGLDASQADPLSDVEARAGNAHRIVWARCGNAGSVSEPAFGLIEN